ncbi:kinase-like domain-containing protein [Pilobolus umbonatus]|nr:kinase-like domain-containing protein [Pilobolus umbonatus]
MTTASTSQSTVKNSTAWNTKVSKTAPPPDVLDETKIPSTSKPIAPPPSNPPPSNSPPKTESVLLRKLGRLGSFFSSGSSRSNSKPSEKSQSQSSKDQGSYEQGPSNSNSNSLSDKSTPTRQGGIVRTVKQLFKSPKIWKKVRSISSSSADLSSSTAGIPNLKEKYGDYIKPDKSYRYKMTGATNKNHIGSGATAVIRLVKSQHDGVVYAVKEFKKKQKSELEKVYLKRMHNEYCVSKAVTGHPNVIATLDLVIDEKKRWCTVMEYCDGGDLFNYIEDHPFMNARECSCLFKQLLMGIQHIHSLGIAHRDIKPENLVMKGGQLKIADFGLADVVQTRFNTSPRKSFKWCGSEPFWSPEMWELKTEKDGYNGKALDIWSAAVTFFCMRFRKLPFIYAFYTMTPNYSIPENAIEGSPAAMAAACEGGGDIDYDTYVNERNRMPAQFCSLWREFPYTEEHHDDVIDCLVNMMNPHPVERWDINRAIACNWIRRTPNVF